MLMLQAGTIVPATPSLLFVFDQIQMVAASSAMAPDMLKSLRRIADTLDWAIQIPVPFLNRAYSEWHGGRGGAGRRWGWMAGWLDGWMAGWLAGWLCSSCWLLRTYT